MNSMDAATRGVKHGDTVKVSSSHGSVIRPAFVTDRMMPGVTTLGEGAWADFDELAGVDRAGASNTLNGAMPPGKARRHTTVVSYKWKNGQASHWNLTMPGLNEYR
jgi:anaerobic dimethyl sulfoxide reductase subunit A